ncbi:MAG: metal ABC transporter solute-binding protein, Zn/Mn family [Acidimicrobiales bacterium]
MRTILGTSLAALAIGVVLAACGGSDEEATTDGATIVVTTSILGDVVRTIVADDATVEVLMPPNADPHDFAPSAQQAAALRAAAVVVVNGLGFEEGLVDTIAAAEADDVVVVAATDAIEPLELGGTGRGHENAGEEGDHEHEGDDPHLFTDPVRMAEAVDHVADTLAAEVDGLDTPAFRERVDEYLGQLAALDAEVEALLEVVPAERRVLVTNHDVFGYFADRYDFEVLGVIVPGGSTLAEPSARDLAELAAEIEEEGVPAIFAEVSSPSRLADSLAAEGQAVQVIELFTESLGEEGSGGETYLEMVRTNAQRIADALGS